MVSKSPPWIDIADELGIERKAGSVGSVDRKRIGMNIAVEEKSQAESKSGMDQAIQRETIKMIRQTLKGEQESLADGLIKDLQNNRRTDDEVRELLNEFVAQGKDRRAKQIHPEIFS